MTPDTQREARWYVDGNGVGWIVQEPYDGSAIDWNKPMNLLNPDGQWHAPKPLGIIEHERVKNAYPKLPARSVKIEIKSSMYRVTIDGAAL